MEEVWRSNAPQGEMIIPLEVGIDPERRQGNLDDGVRLRGTKHHLGVGGFWLEEGNSFSLSNSA